MKQQNNQNKGFILYNRDVILKIKELCTPTEWFVLEDFILRATYYKNTIEYNNTNILLQKGELIFGTLTESIRLNLGLSTIKRTIKSLQEKNLISRTQSIVKLKNLGSIIKVIDYIKIITPPDDTQSILQ